MSLSVEDVTQSKIGREQTMTAQGNPAAPPLWRRWTMTGLFLSALVAQSGCGKQMAQVSGQVKLKNGGAIPGAIRIIRFEPLPDSTAAVRKAASSDIATDGSFRLFTRVPGDGVHLGKYAVTFTVLSGATNGRILIKPEYMNADATPFVVEVTGNTSDLTYEIEMK